VWKKIQHDSADTMRERAFLPTLPSLKTEAKCNVCANIQRHLPQMHCRRHRILLDGCLVAASRPLPPLTPETVSPYLICIRIDGEVDLGDLCKERLKFSACVQWLFCEWYCVNVGALSMRTWEIRLSQVVRLHRSCLAILTAVNFAFCDGWHLN
jgi:hypothetical protein